MVERAQLERKQLWLSLVSAWIIVPPLTILAFRWLDDYSTSALWRWGLLMLWTLVMPTVSALRLSRRVRLLAQEKPDLPDSTLLALLSPAWQMVMLGMLSVLAVMMLFMYYDR